MLSAARLRSACPKCRNPLSISLTQISARSYRSSGLGSSLSRSQASRVQSQLRARTFSTSKALWQTEPGSSGASAEEIERVVREAKQRFRDTLPKGYLNADEYALYERLYGPPLRETSPEDVGIPMHADMMQPTPRPENEGTILRQLEGGEFEEVSYEITQKTVEKGEGEGDEEEYPAIQLHQTPGYIETVARNQREYDALQKLAADFEESQRKQKEEEELAKEREEEEEESELEAEERPEWPEEEEYVPVAEDADLEVGEWTRFHPYTIEGRYHGNPIEMILPQEELVQPVRTLLSRTHPRHVKAAAEEAFGGSGLPLSPATPHWRRNGFMTGVGLPPDTKHMTEIEADAFLSAYLPPAYASVMSIMREVRKCLGPEWLQSRLKQDKEGELSVLDAGAGGGGLVAWQQILQAEWDMLRERGEVTGEHPPGRKTVVVGSDRLRNRIKSFLPETTFLPRLPDYMHSTYKGENLDSGGQQQARKSYDVIIASHLFLKETQEHYRQAVLNNLWSLLKKDGGVLVIVEKAHPRGFEAVAQVRDTILKRFLLPQSGEPMIEVEEANARFPRELEKGHIVAPCTNHQVCPMYSSPGKSIGRKDYCHFSQRFIRPAFYNKMLGSKDNRGEVEFSYVVFQRGVEHKKKLAGKEASEKAFEGYEEATEKPDMQSLPRLILPALKRKGHVIMDMCTAEGKIERWTVTKSSSKLAYHDARKSHWGDLWALGAKTRTHRVPRSGKGPGDIKKLKGVALTAAEKRALKEQRTRGKANKRRESLKMAAEEDEESEQVKGQAKQQALEQMLTEEQMEEQMADEEVRGDLARVREEMEMEEKEARRRELEELEELEGEKQPPKE
ncbi:mitochondrial small ribosomal subunit Rsm22-domain-containing protein [Stachybotrys elegans]|uniref:Mitochondrial small ribosomal subunit Rsm22-domain-containing protein n=1 Tax=Stachybotrys elegans TaxID=80388 RepID=A0A8K0SM31_9HYPO|nr:mitochondrial small ribosomal subunit Rsm22-domain-containing protein [Stachybotrys elegans]